MCTVLSNNGIMLIEKSTPTRQKRRWLKRQVNRFNFKKIGSLRPSKKLLGLILLTVIIYTPRSSMAIMPLYNVGIIKSVDQLDKARRELSECVHLLCKVAKTSAIVWYQFTKTEGAKSMLTYSTAVVITFAMKKAGIVALSTTSGVAAFKAAIACGVILGLSGILPGEAASDLHSFASKGCAAGFVLAASSVASLKDLATEVLKDWH